MTPEIDEDLEDDLRELVSAEEFLDYFDIPYDQSVVHVNRLHILQRFHDYLDKAEPPATKDDWRELYKALLAQAYLDFVNSSALDEKVFKVLKDAAKPAGFVSAGDLLK